MLPHVGLRVLPWKNWEEWKWVMDCFFDQDDLNEKRKGLQRVVSWRMRGNVPHAIDSTAQIIEAWLHLTLSGGVPPQYGQAARSPDELRALLSLAIVRTVNGLVDAKQKGQFALPVSKLAKRIGLPVWLVDLRHEATHSELPSLATLQLAVDFLLGYLHRHYWNPQKEHLEFLKSAYKRLLKEYQKSQKKEDIERITSGLTSSVLGDFILPMLVDVEADLLLPAQHVQEHDEDSVWQNKLSTFSPLLSELQSLCWGVSSTLMCLCYGCITAVTSPGAPSTEESGNPSAKIFSLKWICFLLSWQWQISALKEAPQILNEEDAKIWQKLKSNKASKENKQLAMKPAPFALQVLLGHQLPTLLADSCTLLNTAKGAELEEFVNTLKNVKGLQHDCSETISGSTSDKACKEKEVQDDHEVPRGIPQSLSKQSALPSLEDMERMLGLSTANFASATALPAARSPRQNAKRQKTEEPVILRENPEKLKMIKGTAENESSSGFDNPWQVQKVSQIEQQLAMVIHQPLGHTFDHQMHDLNTKSQTQISFL
mmetsp:Transcript_30456/g.40229  ORF Transcript_30456/g.40229 Transcript_30456/m.40229 type:complete len:542 (-) Transcript_30456:289-1914(-)